MEAVRLRLVFPNRRRILTVSQLSEELNNSWFLINTTIHRTIADVSSHITRIFDLNHSCPYGISLYMDGFVLPPFESTCIFKDKDFIRVKRRKGRTVGEIVAEDEMNLIEGDDVVEKNSVGTDLLLLENGELDNETGSYQNELAEGEVNLVDNLLLVDQSAGDNMSSKRRKTSKKIGKTKVKRKKKRGDIVEVDGVNLIEREDAAEKNHVGTDMLLSANAKLNDETSIYQDEVEEGEVNLLEDLLHVDKSAGKNTGSKKKKKSKKLRNAKEGKTSAETADMADVIELTGKEKIVEKQHLDTGVLHAADEKFEKEANVYQSELQDKEDNPIKGSLIVDSSAIQESGPNKRKASKELERPNQRRKENQDGWLYKFFETYGQAEQNEPCHSPNSDEEKESSVAQQVTETNFDDEQYEDNQCNGLSSRMNVDNMEKVSDLDREREKERAPSSAQGNKEFVEPLPITKSVLHENGAESVGVPQASEETKKISRSTRRQYERRKWRKELKAEAKVLLAENVLIRHELSSIKYRATSTAVHRHNDQNGLVVRPRHIRFEPCEKEEDVQQSRVVMDTCQSIGTTSKKKNQKWGNEKYVYCTRSNCSNSGEECPQLVTLEKEEPQNDSIDFNKLPLLSSFPKEGDIVAYRVLKQSEDAGPILSSFRVGKTLRLDNWAKTLILTPVEENPDTSVKSTDGAWEQDNSTDKENGHIEIDITSLYDVRIVKHTSTPGKEVDKWDTLSQTASLKNSLLARRREWGKVGPSATSSQQEWSKKGSTATWSKKEWGKAGTTATSYKQEWGKVGPTTTSPNKEWGQVGPTTNSSKKEWSNVSHTTSSWSSKPFNNAKKEWSKWGPTTTSSEKEWKNTNATTGSWSSKPFNNANKESGKLGPTMTSSKKDWKNASPTTSSWSNKPNPKMVI